MLRLLALLALLGSCVPDGKPPIYTSFVAGEIGGPCSLPNDCHGGMCFTTQFGGLTGANVDAPGGYCTQLCTVDSECGGSSKCVTGADGHRYCTAFCDGPSHCRDGYVCVPGNHCEPVNLYRFDCDPKANGGVCTLSDGEPGGCVRNALGNGMAGACIRGCNVGGTCPTTGTGCHYYDTSTLGDPFKGTLCYFNNHNPPTPLGGTCTGANDCVSGSNCVTVDGVDYTCKALCDEFTFPCQNGATCIDFNPMGPVMVCNQ